MRQILYALIFFYGLYPALAQNTGMEAEFREINNLDWKLSFEDKCTDSWQTKWVMDGERSQIINGPEGMDYYAGKEAYNDTCHTVLWTKKKFSGAIKVEYDFTRLDTSTLGVNIIYLLAQGSGKGEYKEELFEWNNLRRVPAMKVYFDHVNTYHISYAVNGNGCAEPDYVRARRYMPESGKGLSGTALTPEYHDTGLFALGLKHHIIVILKGTKLFMQVSNPSQTKLFWFETNNLPPIQSGRIGLRHMWTRAARYANIKVFEI